MEDYFIKRTHIKPIEWVINPITCGAGDAEVGNFCNDLGQVKNKISQNDPTPTLTSVYGVVLKSTL